MKVLLTGANGFIGSHLTATFLAEGHAVRAAVRDPIKFLRRFPEAEAVAADLNRKTRAGDWSDVVQGIDAVINCAGILQTRRGNSAVSIHADAPSALFEAGAAAGVNRIVQISAVSAGGPTEYARTKSQADRYLASLALDWTILRPSLVYARDAYGGTAMIRALAVCPLFIPTIGGAHARFSPIHVDDLCKTVLWALESPDAAKRIVEPCGPQDLSLGELMQAYRAWFGLNPAPLLPIPRPFVAVACRLGDVFGAGPLTTTSLRQIEAGNTADACAFVKLTSIEPQPLASMLAREPAGPADLWQARLYLVRPFVRSALVLLWLVSGIVGLLALPASSIYFSTLGIPAGAHAFLAAAVSLVDIAIGLMLALRLAPCSIFRLQLLMVTGYTLALTLAAPALWLDLFGPLLKNFPILALILIDRILEVER